MLWDRVRAGETLNMLAARLDRPACMIMRANRLSSPAWLLPGREIIVPPRDFCAWDAGECPRAFFSCPAQEGGAHIRHSVRAGERVGDVARRYGLPERLVLLACGPSAGGALPPGRTLTLPLPPPGAELITVMPGQSVESLCLRCGMSRERFALINSLSAPLYPGMRVLVERSR